MKNFRVECYDERGVSVLPKGVTATVYTDINNAQREADNLANRLCATRPAYVVVQEFTNVN